MKRRKNGEGSYFIRKNGNYKYYCYRFPNGYELRGKTAKELDEKVKAHTEEQTLLNPKFDNMFIFSDYCRLWLKSRRGYISERVYDDYESIIDTRISKYPLGDMQIKGITVNAINMYFTELSQKYSKASIDKTYIVIKQVLKYGMEEQDIPIINLDKIIRIKETQVVTKKKDIPFITSEDAKLLTEEMESGKYGDGAKALIFIIHSGLRLSELTELKWQNVAEDLQSIKINQASAKVIQRDKNLNPVKKDGKNVYMKLTKGTKTEDGQRIIPMSKKGKEILLYFKQISNPKNDYVFINKNGEPYTKRVLERLLSRMLNNSKCKCKDYTPHCLRHGYGSILIQNGVDIKIVSELLGHTDVAFTYNTYIGVTKEDKAKAVNNTFDNL